jgi:trehalose 6-phosphate phosphatase
MHRGRAVRQIAEPTIATEIFDVANCAFLLDFDGTLVDIAPTPQSVQVPPSLPSTLRQLAAFTGGATALVSGRALKDLDRLIEPAGIALVGGHGAELRLWRDGSAEELHAPKLDDTIRRGCNQIVAGREGVLLEDKGYSIAIHYRLAPDQEASIRRAVADMVANAPADGLEVLRGKAVIEIKHAGLTKGSGIRTLMTHAPFAGRRPVFVGDDITDEDAFAAMPEFSGLALSVGRTVKNAERRFETPAEVRGWIEEICRTAVRPDA